MSIFEKLRAAHADWDPAFPKDWPAPGREVLEEIQATFGIRYPEDFVQWQLVEGLRTPMGDRAWDEFGWANNDLEPMHNLRTIVEDAREMGIDAELAPFKSDNGDYFCCTTAGEVVLWDHNRGGLETDPAYRWPSFSAWLEGTFDE